MAKGYVLVSKSGKIFPNTFDVDKRDCWHKSFSFVLENYGWMRPYWKDWNGSIKAAEKRGYQIKCATLKL